MHRAGGREADAVFDIAAWARDALALLAGRPGVSRAGLALAEGGGRRLRFTASDRDSGSGLDWCHVDAYDDVPLNTAVRMGRPVIGTLDVLAERYGDFVARQHGTAAVALACLPVVAAGQTLGGYVVFFDSPPPLDTAQRTELVRLGAELGAGLRRAQRGEAPRRASLVEEALPPGADVAFHDVTAGPAGVGEARRFLARTLTSWGVDDETTYTAVLCLSELVTNAVLHAHVGSVVRVMLDAGVLTTTVRDPGAERHCAATESLDDPLRVHGRGLQLVETLSTRWGSELDSVGTTVWFVLEP